MRIGLLVAALSVTVLFAALGMWQLDRAAQKRVMFAEFERRGERTVRQILPELPHVRIGSAVVVPIDLLREWLRDRAQQEKGAVDQAVEEVLDGLS